MPRIAALAAVLSFVVSTASCGTGSEEATTATPTTQASVPALADGTVPWLDQPVEDEEFSIGRRPRRTVPSGAKRCRAEDLVGTMPRWTAKGDTDDGTPRSSARGLFGFVEVRNRSPRTCTLQGEVPTRLLVDGTPLGIRTSHGVNEESQRRVTAVPPSEAASLRIDWSTPFCGEASGRQTLEMTLPHDGGLVTADVVEAMQPACTSSETHPELRSYVSASAFDEPAVPTPLDSPFNAVTVAVTTPPTTATAGALLRYVVAITNPTSADIPLDPCPGYAEERFSTGDARYRALNERSTYRLNCRTVAALPAGGTVRFEMHTRIPAQIEVGRQARVAWRLLARALAPTDAHSDGFTVTVG
jgi:hypothetical protein